MTKTPHKSCIPTFCDLSASTVLNLSHDVFGSEPPSNLSSCYLRLQEMALNLFLLFFWTILSAFYGHSERNGESGPFQRRHSCSCDSWHTDREPGTGRQQFTAGHTGPPKPPKTCWHGPASHLACPEWLTRTARLYFQLLQFGLNIVSCAVSAKFMQSMQRSGPNNNSYKYGNANTYSCASMISHVIAFRNVSTQFITQHRVVLHSQHYHKGASLLRLVFTFRSTPVMAE